MTYDTWKEAAVDAELTNRSLHDEIKRLKGDLNESERQRHILKMDLMFANDKLRARGLTTEPYEVDDCEFECGTCNLRLEGEWEWCPGCGKRIEWDNVRYPDDDGWYADEGERFLQEAVYDPIREAMRA